jgi:hypothetical protein
VPAQVTGLSLSPNTVVYYYTYGSVLAALSRPQDNKCVEALDVLTEVKGGYGSDPDIAGIISAGETICASLGTTASSETGSAPGIMEDSTPTASP